MLSICGTRHHRPLGEQHIHLLSIILMDKSRNNVKTFCHIAGATEIAAVKNGMVRYPAFKEKHIGMICRMINKKRNDVHIPNGKEFPWSKGANTLVAT